MKVGLKQTIKGKNVFADNIFVVSDCNTISLSTVGGPEVGQARL